MKIKTNIYSGLKRSPLFNLSLSSKELFHSNFLAWLAEQYPESFRTVFEDLGCDFFGCDKFEVKREYQNLDLCLLTPKPDEKVFFILENKVKSLPRLDQLKEYDQKKIKKHDLLQKKNKILLSLATEIPDKKEIENEGWTICNYEWLSKKLRELSKEKFCNNSYEYGLISDYCDVIEYLHELAESWKINDSITWKDLLCKSDDIQKLRVEDIQEKIRFSFLFGELRSKLGTSLQDVEIVTNKNVDDIFSDSEYTGKIYLNQGFTQKKGLLEVKVKINEEYILIVQVQDKCYLHAIEWKKEGNAKTKDEGFSEYWAKTCEQKDFVKNFLKLPNMDLVKYPSVCSSTPSVPCKHKGEDRFYNKYNGKSSAFLYQYSKIMEDAEISKVLDAIVDDVRMLLAIQKDFKERNQID